MGMIYRAAFSERHLVTGVGSIMVLLFLAVYDGGVSGFRVLILIVLLFAQVGHLIVYLG